MLRRLPTSVVPFLTLVFLLQAPGAHAQSRTTSALRGEVFLPDGTPAAGAAATLEDLRIGTEVSTVSSSEGAFLFLSLRPGGPYRLRLQIIGHAPITVDGLNLPVGEMLRETHRFQVEAVALAGITVEADRSDIFGFEGVGQITILNRAEIAELPLLSRDLLDLTVLSPLVTRTEEGGLSFAGQNDRYNAILVDGIWAKDPFGATPGGIPGGLAGARLLPIDAVAQYEILSAPYDVRLSGFTGGVMNAVTRSGTNERVGSAFAARRDPLLGGPLRFEDGSAEGSEVTRNVFGFSLGGPIKRDVAHFFVATEFDLMQRPPQGYNFGRDDPLLHRLNQPDLSEAIEAFGAFIGEDPGDAGVLDLSRDVANVFARVDWQLSPEHRLVVRNVFAWAGDDAGPNRLGFDPYGLSSNGVRRTGLTNGLSLEVASALSRNTSNELTLLYQFGSDRSNAVVNWPQLDAEVFTSIEGRLVSRDLRAGASLSSQRNSLNQSQIRLSNNLTTVRGRATWTVGVTGALYGFEQDYLPGSAGQYRFTSSDSLAAGRAEDFRFSYLAMGEPDALEFSVAEVGALAQGEFETDGGLTLRLGLRADLPFVRATVAQNERALQSFGYDTGNLPSGNVQISPRASFSYLAGTDRRTRLRGGAGLFTGQTPFVWLADAMQHNGLRVVETTCDPRNVRYTEGVVRCGIGVPHAQNVSVFSEDFRYPQDLRLSLGIDHEVTDRVTVSAGLIHNRALSQMRLQELNLGDPTDTGPLRGYDAGGLREFFGDGATSFPFFSPVRDDPALGRVLLASNASDDQATAATFEARAQIGEYQLRGGYTWTQSWDRMSLIASDMPSNFGLTPVGTHPNSQPLATSNFERPHKASVAVSGMPFGDGGPAFSLLWTGQSGVPFSFVYNGDLNGDGYPGFGATFEKTNDLFYVPTEASEIPQSIVTVGLMEKAIRSNPCLAAWVGRTVPRNSCRSPWQNSLDLRITQGIKLTSARIRLELDVVNALNLINSGWGQVQTVRSVVPILDFTRRTETLKGYGPLFSRWSGATYRAANGDIRPSDPWTPSPGRSQWQIQLGARVEFGGG